MLLVVGCKLGEIATKRFTDPAAGKPSSISTSWPRRSAAPPARRGAVGRRARRRSRIWPRRSPTAASARARRARDYADERAASAWRRGAPALPTRLTSNETPINVARLMHELNAPDAGGRRSWSPTAASPAHWGGLLYDTKRAGPRLRARPRLRLDRLRPAGRASARAGGARAAAWSALTGDGGFNMTLGELETARRIGLAVRHRRVQQRRLRLREGAAAPRCTAPAPTSPPTSPRRTTPRSREAHGLQRHPRRGPGRAGAALREGSRRRGPTVIDVVVTRDPAKMLPAVDNRTVAVQEGRPGGLRSGAR